MFALSFHGSSQPQHIAFIPITKGLNGSDFGNATMNNTMMMGPGTHKMEMESSGLGDTRIGALQNIYHKGGRKLHLNLMVSLPTGSISEKTTNMMGNKVQQSYAMQLGSGTYDLLPGITYVSQFEKLPTIKGDEFS